ncbi:MAG: peptidyl-prolyl cis-trans isomerase [Deltaproteobacteria bacterium]|nr:peptidyl-prolyl cis-trans isomerase [Deltaproteobacteria bacterium]
MTVALLAAVLYANGKSASPAFPRVQLETSQGKIVIELYPEKAPLSVENFLKYVNDGFYDGLIFHRVVPGFVVQGGGYTPDFKPRQVRAPIKLEAQNGLSNARGTVAMARTGNPNSATSQFFINLVDNTQLDTLGGGYAVFGRVVSGLEVADAIAKLKLGPQGGPREAPVEGVVIKKARLLK